MYTQNIRNLYENFCGHSGLGGRCGHRGQQFINF